MHNEPALVKLLLFFAEKPEDPMIARQLIRKRMDRIRNTPFNISFIESPSLHPGNEPCFWVRLFSCDELVLPLNKLSAPIKTAISQDVQSGKFTHIEVNHPYPGCKHFMCHSEWDALKDAFSVQAFIENVVEFLGPRVEKSVLEACGLASRKRPRHTRPSE